MLKVSFLLAKVHKILRLSNKNQRKSAFFFLFLVYLPINKYLCSSLINIHK